MRSLEAWPGGEGLEAVERLVRFKASRTGVVSGNVQSFREGDGL